jgi:hypothetical protein
MPLFMDTHTIKGATPQALVDAHKKDLAAQEKHGVHYLKYWLDEQTGRIHCLVDAPDKDAAVQVHREAHGLLADEIHEVKEYS